VVEVFLSEQLPGEETRATQAFEPAAAGADPRLTITMAG